MTLNAIQLSDERLERIYSKIHQQVTSEMETLRIRVSESERRVLEESSSLKKLLTVSDYELQRMLQNFEVETKRAIETYSSSSNA